MIGKNIEDVKEEDLLALIDSSVRELRMIDYKRLLPGNSDSEKKEFLADVSSFANANGGDIIFGMIEEGGIPKELIGLDIENVDQEILRLETIIRNGIRPRIPAVKTWAVKLSNSKTVLIIRISKSWISPHRVVFQGWDKFFSRSSNGKYPLDVDELRIAFTMSETISERIRNFREDRIAKIFNNETPVSFYENAKIVLHLIPIVSFNVAQSYDIEKIASQPEKILPIEGTLFSYRYNFDGFLSYSSGSGEKSYSYVQLFRNGIIEFVDGLVLKGSNVIPSLSFEQILSKALQKYLLALKILEVELPNFVFLTLLGVKGYSMAVDKYKYWREETQTIDRDVLMLPEIIINSYDVDVKDALRPCLDSVWNACGYPRSLNYDDKGK